MTEITKEVSNKIANMGFLCACLVVFIHCPKSTSAMEGVTLVRLFHSVFPGALSSMANAFFFTVAGFFLAGHVFEGGWWKVEVRKRFYSLFIPYVILNLCWFACQAVYQWPNIRFGATAHPFEWLDILRALGFYGWGIPANGPLWFVRTLLLLVITFPIYAVILKRGARAAWSLVVMLFSLYIILDGFIHPSGFWSKVFVSSTYYRFWTIGYFCLGATLRLYVKRLRLKPMVGLLLLFIGMTISSYLNLTRVELDIQETGLRWLLYCLSCPLMMVGVWSIVSEKTWPKVFTGNAFPIYALHWPLIMLSYIVCSKTHTHDLIFGNLFFSVLYISLVVIVTIFAAIIIRKQRVLFKLLLGGR